MAHQSSSVLGGATRTTTPVPVPNGAAVNHIGTVGLFIQDSGTITPPAGFAQKYDSGLVIGVRLVTFWKRLTASDTGTWDFTHASSWTRAVAELTNGRVTTGDPFTDTDGTPPTTGSSTVVVPSLDAAALDDLVGVATCFNDDSWTPPAGMTEQQDNTQGITLATQDAVTAGATGTLTFTASSASGISGWVGALAAAQQDEGTRNASAMRAMTGGRF